MIYLVDPAVSKSICTTLGCKTYCGIKPCYGVIVVDE
jgi:hypothetical protein